MNAFDFLKRKTVDLGSTASNQLPDRANLFLRYMSGLGNKNLDLDERTLDAAREFSVDFPEEAFTLEKGATPFGEQFEYKKLKNKGIPFALKPRSGPVSSYGLPQEGHSLSNTLGRYNVAADPEKGVRITDTYDMSNAYEDPDLTSGKFQPRKAWNEIASLWNPSAGFRNNPDPMVRLKGRDQNVPFDFQHLKNTFEDGKYDSTYSPLTRLARAGMYVGPFKPTPFDIDVTVPYEGRIGNSETYSN